jgi:hypothetical protein
VSPIAFPACDTEEGRSVRRFPSTGKDDNWRQAMRSIKGWLLSKCREIFEQAKVNSLT